ncbi:hypothetical protein V6N13_092972 [Hibiscus sabdariffa]|uniref:Uncharacterized protein n=2 Tax=Hibiscus sabdariffa TaxID=183260 RepID=A0ABR2NQM7_9ROSI
MQTETNISRSSIRSRAVPVIPTCMQNDPKRVSPVGQTRVIKSNTDRASEATWEGPSYSDADPVYNIIDPDHVVVTEPVRNEGHTEQQVSRNDESITKQPAVGHDHIQDELTDQ